MKKRGIALIWALVTSAVMLMLATVLANISIKEIQSARRTDNSQEAYANAKTGIEWAIDFIANGSGDNGTYIFNQSPTSKFTVTISTSGNDRVIVSEGKINNLTTRRIEYKIRDSAINVVPCASNQFAAVATSNSFDWKFDFTLKDAFGSGTSTASAVTTSGQKIDVVFSRSGANYTAQLISGGTSSSLLTLNAQGQNVNEELKFRASVRYVKNIGAELKIEFRDDTVPAAQENLKCVKRVSIPLTTTLGAFQYVRLDTQTQAPSCQVSPKENYLSNGKMEITNVTLTPRY